jgi:hypothetical protein
LDNELGAGADAGRLQRFGGDQRVLVMENVDGLRLDALGTVHRIRRDGGAWIALDKRAVVDRVHPFPADDPTRARHVLAYPQGCRAAVSATIQGEFLPTLADFGRDHWSTFGYLLTLGPEGVPDRHRMRCDPARHPFLAHIDPFGQVLDGRPFPTRLSGGRELVHHDDWDCCDDLERAGLIEMIGTGAHPRVQFTEHGHRVARQLAMHKMMRGGSFGTFQVEPADAQSTKAAGGLRRPEW